MASSAPIRHDLLPIPTSIPEELGPRRRVMTSKGQEYSSELKGKIASSKEREFRTKLSEFEVFIQSCCDPKEVQRKLLALTSEADEIMRSFDDWIVLLEDSSDIEIISEKKQVLVDIWQSVYLAAQTRLRQLYEDDTKSITSFASRRSAASSASSKIVEVKAKKAALQKKIKFRAVIAEQEKKLEQLRLQQEYEELNAQEAVYQQAEDEENRTDGIHEQLAPSDTHYVMKNFLNDSQPKAFSTPVTALSASTDVTTNSTWKSTFTIATATDNKPELKAQMPQIPETVKQSTCDEQIDPPKNPDTSHKASTEYAAPSTYRDTTVSYSQGRQVPPVFPTPRLDPWSRPFFPHNSGYASQPVYVTPAQDNSVLLADTLTRVTQLQRLPQAKPDVFRGDEKDKAKYFLWENAFDALIDSVPVTSQQKLHLLYQHLDGKAKSVVEQLQYMVKDPEYAYSQARKILKERFGHGAVIGTEFERKLLHWPKIGPTDASALEEFGDFLKQVEIASEHIKSLKLFNFPSQIQLLAEKLPGWFKAKWSDKVMKLQKEKGKDAFPSFKQFVEVVCYEAERMNIPQIAQASQSIPQKNNAEFVKSLSRQPRRSLRNPAAATTLMTVSTKDNTTNNDTTLGFKEPSDPPRAFCFYHNSSTHSTSDCEQFSKLSFDERKALLVKKKVCFNCVESDKHVAKRCNRKRLECRICGQKHATILHDPSKHEKHKDTDSSLEANSRQFKQGYSQPNTTLGDEEGNKVKNACTQICGQSQSRRSCARIVLLQVFHQEDPSIRIPTYAVLDDQSTDVFVTDSLLNQLKRKGPDVTLEINTIVGVNSIRTQKVNGLRIQDIEGHHQPIKIASAYSQDQIPANQSDIATPEVAKHWPHLAAIARHIHYRPDIEIGLLIGRNVPTAFQPLHVVYGKEEEPWAEEYKFGWTIIGPVCLEDNVSEHNTTVNRITVMKENHLNTDDPSSEVPLISYHKSKDVTSPQQVREMMQLDYSELHYNRNVVRGTEQVESLEDKRFNSLLEEGIHRNEKGNLEMPLPFKSDNVSLPNNRQQCLQRLIFLKRKLLKNPKTHKDYIEFMQKIMERGHASAVPKEELETTQGKVWYLPHFDVYHQKKPEQIRVVFDCSAVFQGDSLNKHLLQGPDWMNALVGVLSRFRKEEVAVTCDIEQMFYSFAVNTEHRDFLRFLWYQNGDLEGPIIEYRMNVHLFGAVSSPGVANFGLKKTADQGREQFGDEASNFLKNEFYVDDGLKSFSTPEKAIDVILNSQAMCASNKLRLHKFASNSKVVLEAIPAEDRAKDLKDLDLRHDVLPIQRSLGTYWCIETDTLGFRIQLRDKPCTRRGILSTISSVYDPLGIASPVVLIGKQILQDLCRSNIDWDEPIPDDVLFRWEKWRSQLPLLERIKINRCVKPIGFGEPTTAQIHSFADASDKGLGQVSYLRLENQEGQVNVSFLMAKARVAPVKPMSTPRMELTAAVISVNVASMLSQELAYTNMQEVYYTDSSAVIGYINNDAKRFHNYVGNRVQHIRDRSEPHQWHHVEGENNPADEASRGVTADKLLENTRWFQGPGFLWRKEIAIENRNPNIQLDPQDTEVRKNTASVLTLTKQSESTPTAKDRFGPEGLEAERFNHSSSLPRLKRSIVRIQRMIENRRPNKQYNWRPADGPPLVKELKVAEALILKSLQRQHFSAEIKVLRKLEDNENKFQDRDNARTRNNNIKLSSSLYRLDPFLDENGLVRVGGRVCQADVPLEAKHPLIIPKGSHVTELIIREFHAANYHQGYGITHNALRQNGYWIINGRSEVSRLISKCVTCRKLRSERLQQKMSDLPPERINPAAPFTYTGMDVFGPWYVKEGRKEVKRWGIIFTCLASRAVHLETLNSMDTDSFINALRRFISRRGKVQELRSDQGTNFVGAKNELASAMKEINKDTVKNFLGTKECDWIEFSMNVPCASHMGGAWERLIRTVRAVITGLLRDHGTQLDDEGLRTLMTEAENIVNNRPLSVANLSDATAAEPITPNHLLTLKTKTTLPPPGEFSRPDLYTRKRWRRVQFLTEQFWHRWRKEYCSLQYQRQKWNRTSRNVQVGDIVLMRDEDVSRNKWPLAKVVEVYPSADKLVRKVKLLITSHGKRSYFERPIHKLVLLLAREEYKDTVQHKSLERPG